VDRNANDDKEAGWLMTTGQLGEILHVESVVSEDKELSRMVETHRANSRYPANEDKEAGWLMTTYVKSCMWRVFLVQTKKRSGWFRPTGLTADTLHEEKITRENE
jgi:hypothetical protein